MLATAMASESQLRLVRAPLARARGIVLQCPRGHGAVVLIAERLGPLERCLVVEEASALVARGVVARLIV